MSAPGTVFQAAQDHLSALQVVRSANDYIEAAQALLPDLHSLGANDPRFFAMAASVEKAHSLLARATELMDPEGLG